jgi:hypothetical protein
MQYEAPISRLYRCWPSSGVVSVREFLLTTMLLPGSWTCVGIGSVVAAAIGIVVENATGERRHRARHERRVEPRGHLRGRRAKPGAIARAPSTQA